MTVSDGGERKSVRQARRLRFGSRFRIFRLDSGQCISKKARRAEVSCLLTTYVGPPTSRFVCLAALSGPLIHEKGDFASETDESEEVKNDHSFSRLLTQSFGFCSSSEEKKLTIDNESSFSTWFRSSEIGERKACKRIDRGPSGCVRCHIE